MEARPNIFGPFYKKNNLSYVLLFNTADTVHKFAIPLKNVPIDVLDAGIAHELSHIIQYQQTTRWQLFFLPSKFVFSSSFKKNFETEADNIASQHSFTDGLHKYFCLHLNNSNVSAEYKKRLKEFYMEQDCDDFKDTIDI